MTELGYPYTKPRCPVGAMYSSPGPVYLLPPLIGEKGHDIRSTHVRAPAYSLAKPLKDLSTERSPGPAAYAQNGKFTNTGEAYSPKYTITGIQKQLKSGSIPGPAEYDVSTSGKLVYPGSPAYQMGLQLKGKKTDDVPAPNAYSLPPPHARSEVLTAPNYTMAGRNESSFFILNKNPGPADYSVGSPDIYMNANPKYTMGTALSELKKADLPSPLHYRAEDVKSHLPGVPKFTMGIKHSPYKGEFAIQYDD